MINDSSSGIFDDVIQFPDTSARRRLAGLVGLDSVKERLVKEGLMRLQPHSLEKWSEQHHGSVLPALQFFRRRPPLFILAGDVGTGKTELAETFGDDISRRSGIPIFLHSLSLTARGSGAVGEMTRLISGAFASIKSQAKSVPEGGVAGSGHILLIDEADALAQSRESSQMHHEDRAGVNALIRGIDDLAEGRRPLLIVMCTNRLASLDPAIVRRSAATFSFSRPSTEQRRAVLRNAFPDVVCSNTELEEVAALTGANQQRSIGFSYSDLTQRLVPAVVVAAFPEKRIDGRLITQIASEMEPTPTFAED